MGEPFTFDQSNPLHRCPGESTRANSALHAYFGMGVARSLRALLERFIQQKSNADTTERPPTARWWTLSTWSKKYEWQARVAAQDALDLAEDEATWRERRRSALERDWTVSDKLLALAEQILAEGPKFLKATTRTVKGRPAKVNTEGQLLDPGEPDQKVTIIALSADLAVKAATAGSDLSRRATGLDVQKHEITGKEGGPIETRDVGLTDAERLAALSALHKRVSAEADRQPAGEGDDQSL